MFLLINKKKLLTSLLPITLFCQSACADGGVMPAFAAAHGVALQTPYNGASMFQGLQKPDVCYPPSPIMPTYASSFIDFASLAKVGEKRDGRNNNEIYNGSYENSGSYNGVYEFLKPIGKKETYYVKQTIFFLREYLASLFLQEFYPQGSAVVKLIKNLPGYVASREIKGFVPFKNLDRSTLKDVSYQSSVELCVVRNILGIDDLNNGNAGIKRGDDGSIIDAGVDYDWSFSSDKFLSCYNTANEVSKDDLLSAYQLFLEKYPHDFFEQSFANIKYFVERHLSNVNPIMINRIFKGASENIFQKYEAIQDHLIMHSQSLLKR